MHIGSNDITEMQKINLHLRFAVDSVWGVDGRVKNGDKRLAESGVYDA